MKALFHARCGDIRAPAPDRSWVYCRCGLTAMRWTDPDRGIAQLASLSRDDRPYTRVLGLNNVFLYGEWNTLRTGGLIPLSNEEWQKLHNLATDAPGYLFDNSRRACALAIIAPGESSDTSWVDWPQTAAEMEAEMVSEGIAGA